MGGERCSAGECGSRQASQGDAVRHGESIRGIRRAGGECRICYPCARSRDKCAATGRGEVAIDRAGEIECAGADGGRAGVGVVAREGERAAAVFGNSPGARDRGRDRVGVSPCGVHREAGGANR